MSISGQLYRQICMNVHTWRGIRILVIFATIEKKTYLITYLNDQKAVIKTGTFEVRSF